MQKLISINNVTVAYEGVTALDNISIEIEELDFLGVIGPNGGGKTTFVKLLLGLLSPVNGTLKKYSALSDNVGYLPQKSGFDTQFPISIREVIESGFINKSYFRKKSSKRSAMVDKIIDDFGLGELAGRQISTVSGGQLQKALLARAVVSQPKLLILDEPDTYIDTAFEKEMYRLLKQLNNEMAIVLVSHDAGMISGYVKSVACINKALHYHKGGKICKESMQMYNCPIDLITHGDIPHRVLTKHDH